MTETYMAGDLLRMHRTHAISAAKEAVVEAAREWEKHYATTHAGDGEYVAARFNLHVAIRHLNELEQHQ